MGFLGPDLPVVTKSPRRKVEKKTKSLDPSQRGCDACTLRAVWGTIVSPKMPMTCPPGADVLVLGEAPGEEEDKENRQFIGKSGQLLRTTIGWKKLQRVAFQNICRCRPPQNRDPTDLEAHACSLHLEHDIEKLRPRAILGLGGAPLRRFYPRAAITEIHGLKFPVQIGSHVCWYYPTFHPAFILRQGGKGANHALFTSEIKRFFNEVDFWGKPEIHTFDPTSVVQVFSDDDLKNLTCRLDKSSSLGVDIETSGGLKPYKPNTKILTAAVSDGKLTIAWPIKHPGFPTQWGFPRLFELVNSGPWAAHNVAYELLWIWYTVGLLHWFPKDFKDAMAIGRVIHERPGMLGLDDMTRLHLGFDVKQLMHLDKDHLDKYPLSEVLPYNGMDAYAEALLIKKLNTGKAHSNVDRMLGSIRATTAMEIMGLPVDLSVTHKLAERMEKVKAGNQEKFNKLYETQEWERRYAEPLSISSPDQIGRALVEIDHIELPANKKGFSTEDSLIEPIAKTNPLAACVLIDRHHTKLLSTYLDPIRHKEHHGTDGLIHPSYDSVRVRTGRLSSEGPNIQNFPKHKNREIRRQIIPPSGYLIMPMDYANLEVRIMAMASRDKNLCKYVIDKFDMHIKWRDRIYSLDPDWFARLATEFEVERSNEKALLKIGRQEAKSRFTFASFYGSTADSIAANMHLPIPIARKLHEELWTEHPDVLQWIKRQRDDYAATGTVTLLTGFTRHSYMPGNEIINTPIQGTAAHLVLDTQNELCEIAFETKNMNLHPRINVHDDLTSFIPDDDTTIEEYMKVIAEVATKIRYDWQIVPLAVEFSLGQNWADLEEIGTYTGAYVQK